MGSLTSAVLCYGIRLDGSKVIPGSFQGRGESVEEPVIEDSLVEQVFGYADPCYEAPAETLEADLESRTVWGEYRARKRKFEEEFGVTLVCCPNGVCILAATASIRTCWSEPSELGCRINARGGWRRRIRNFCEAADLPHKNPQFFLCGFPLP